MKIQIVGFAIVGLFVFTNASLAKTAGCPCSPCKCSPCTCGGGGGSKSSSGGGKHHDDVAKHHDKGHGHDRGGGVGVGGSVDLGGVGQRHAEPNPFAVGGGSEPVAHTQEKHKPKTAETPAANPFSDVHLTGEQAKGETPPGPINVNNDDEQAPKFGWGDTKEKEPEKKPEKKLTNDEYDELNDAKSAYWRGLFALEDKMNVDLKAVRQDLKTLDRQNSPELKKKADEYNKLLKKLQDTFYKSDEGKKAFDVWLKTYEKFYKTGAKIPEWGKPTKDHPFLRPYAVGDDMTNKKYALDSAERKLQDEKGKYEKMQNDAVRNNDAYQKLGSEADKEKAAKEIAKEWASTDEAKNQMKQVQEAEKSLDQAKQDFKPYEKYAEEKTKSASNP